MSVSFEIKDAREAPAGAATPVMVERPKSAMQARRSPLINMFAFGCEYGDGSFKRKLYPFQIPMDYAKVVHILQALCNINELNTTSVGLMRDQVITYELHAVSVTIHLDEIINVPILHPLGDQNKPVFAHRHSEERDDVGMPKVFPSNTLSTESL